MRRLVTCAFLTVALSAASLGLARPSGAAARVPIPAGPKPSSIAKEVCAGWAQQEMLEALGVTARVSKPKWVNHLYSCQYRYRNGAFALSVKELSSWTQTKAYFASLGRAQGQPLKINGLGQGAYQTSNGDVVVRKDFKVLKVDISGLPAKFGKPATSAANAGVTIADVILGCWAGD